MSGRRRPHVARSNTTHGTLGALSEANSGANLILQIPRPYLGVLLVMCYGASPLGSMSHSEEARAAYLSPHLGSIL